MTMLTWRVASVLCAGALLLGLVVPGTVGAEPPVLDWDTGAGKSYVIPAAEIAAFLFGLNQVNRHVSGETDYDSEPDTWWKNFRTAPGFDRDPFGINQLGHPYQGSVYYGLARSAGLNYWESLLYTIGGSVAWETFGEKTRPSANDHIATGIAGTFVGEALFRMASLLLEHGGETPGFWRELGAAVLSPPTGFNRLVFGERFRPVFPSRDPALFVRLRVGATLTTNVTNEAPSVAAKRQEGSLDYYMTYGLPGKPGYRYTRPFDFFLFEFTAVPNATSAANAIENVTIRGLLLGKDYDVGDDYRGVWGLFGGYEYLSPQVFRVASTNLSVGTVAQWWLTRTLALQGMAFAGIGFGAAGTVGDQDERDYHYGVIPEGLLSLRLIAGELAMLEASGRQYHVIGTGSGGGPGVDTFGREVINRGTVGLTVRVFGPHAIGLHYVVSSRNATPTNRRETHQTVETVTLSYNFLGHSRFGAVEWRAGEIGAR
ncbi:MAG TPA: DUF3943 domain-containing protein [Candidatus Acidoferrum sp.]|nr:DUF3943 domain-containing protein [Candidatus Acidoferrum sp.]